jgi:hypothetical protein
MVGVGSALYLLAIGTHSNMAGAMSFSLPLEIAGHEDVTSLEKKVGQISF